MKRFGLLSRLSIGLRTLVASLLAIGAAVLAIDLAERNYLRWDLSLSGRNTLDETVLDLLDQLPEPVVADVFLRPLAPPYDRVCLEAGSRMIEVLRVAEGARRSRIDVRVHDPSELEATQRRQRELGVEGVNLVVFSKESGTQQSVQKLLGDVAVIDWGRPTAEGLRYLAQQGIVVGPSMSVPVPGQFREARLSDFRGEEVLAEALLKVSADEKKRVYFSTGQGEPSLEGTEPVDLSRLKAVLENDGFEVLRWSPAETPAVPADCEVLALIGATQALPPGTIEAVTGYVDEGGRVVAAPSLSEMERGDDGGIVELLRNYGMISQPGIVCEPVVSLSGQEVWSAPECADVLVMENGLAPSHRLTEPLRRRARHLRFWASGSFRRGGLESGGVLLDLVSSSRDSWLDLPVAPGTYDYTFDPRRERRDRQRLCMLAELPVTAVTAGEAVRKGHVLGIAGANFFSNAFMQDNRDFLLNSFNHLADRDYRVRVSPLPRGESRLDLARGSALPVLSWSLNLGLPALCVVVGLALAWRRRS